MRELSLLIYNEFEKIYRKKRFLVVALILIALIPLFLYGQYKQVEAQQKRLGTKDWRVALQQNITDGQNRLQSSNMPEQFKKYRKLLIQQQKYYLDNDINPSVPGAPTFVREFIAQGITLFVPLLVLIISIDLISGEKVDGTIKMLLTRPIHRWKILLSKYLAMILGISIVITIMVLISYILSGITFGFSGFYTPIITGFSISGDQLVADAIRTIPHWQYIMMEIGLAWFVAIIVGTLSFMVSILVRNTPTGMGIMFATIIAGMLLQELATNWEGVKYIYSVNLRLTDYLSGSTPVLSGLSLMFSLMILSIWGIGALIVSFFVFTREDMLA